MTPHPALSPGERVSMGGSPEGSMIAGFVALFGGSNGTLMLDAFVEPTSAVFKQILRRLGLEPIKMW